MRTVARRWSFRGVSILFSSAFVLFLATGFATAGTAGARNPITKEADKIQHLYFLVTAMGLVVFVAVAGALLFMVFRYRKRSDELPPQTHGNNLLEIVWTTIPIVIVLILFVFSFITLVNVEHDSKPENMTVEVTGFQFQWQFVYKLNDLGKGSNPNAQGEVTVIGKAGEQNEPTLVIPVNEPVEFKLVSHDVIHSFFVRDFLYKLDVIPGRDNRFTVTANETGTFTGQCAELCGINHALMRFHVKVVTRDEFDKFIADQSGQKAVLQQ